jgi:transcriptional regulator with XRE-family HTH domain
MALIAALIAKRKSAGLTQDELAAKLKVYQSHIARLESGQRRLDVIELIDIADALNFDPNVLIAAIQGNSSITSDANSALSATGPQTNQP